MRPIALVLTQRTPPAVVCTRSNNQLGNTLVSASVANQRRRAFRTLSDAFADYRRRRRGPTAVSRDPADAATLEGPTSVGGTARL